MSFVVHTGDAIEQMRLMPAESVNCCVTSPPYWGLRDYGVDGQIGHEPTLAAFLMRLVDVFREVRRVLKPDGTLWVNMGDSYIGRTGSRRDINAGLTGSKARIEPRRRPGITDGLKHKDMAGQPWRLAFALQADGWWLRSEIIWEKPNAKPESVTDRPTRSHEHLFLLAKSAEYEYDQDALREPIKSTSRERSARGRRPSAKYAGGNSMREPETMLHNMEKCCHPKGRNKRTVWSIPTAGFPGSHVAPFPVRLARDCILAGCPGGGVVFDPFTGSGTTGVAAIRCGRSFVGIELHAQEAGNARARIANEVANGRQQSIDGVA